MNNDSNLKFTAFKITIAIIISLILHLVFFAKFDFTEFFKTKNSYQANELEILVTSEIEKNIEESKEEQLTKSNNNKKKLSNAKLDKKNLKIKPIVKENLVEKNQKKIREQVVIEKNSLDKIKILSNLSDMDLNVKPQTKNKSVRIKSISAKSPEYIYRLYFEAWKKKVERMGSMNYPNAAKINNSFSNLIMKVTINSSGTVHNISIIKSSGNDALDLAASEIVKSGSPYAPFSEQMKREVDKVNITRVWKFIEDQSFSSTK